LTSCAGKDDTIFPIERVKYAFEKLNEIYVVYEVNPSLQSLLFPIIANSTSASKGADIIKTEPELLGVEHVERILFKRAFHQRHFRYLPYGPTEPSFEAARQLARFASLGTVSDLYDACGCNAGLW